ncbi:TlpA family protein disulfide reductase [Elioraea sp. Yellowstone]|nr:TlpA family protein disulfide reductase [Elioraea sp. Yellowstone]
MSRRALVGGAAASGAMLVSARQGSAETGRLVERRPRAALAEAAFRDEGGAEWRLADFAGRGLVVNLWATWCPPCVAEMPALDRLAALVREEGIEVLALSQDRGGAEVVRRFYARTGVHRLGIWLDPRGAAARAWGVRGLPTTLIIDRAGLEAARLEGPAEWDEPALAERIRGLVVPGRGASDPTART